MAPVGVNLCAEMIRGLGKIGAIAETTPTVKRHFLSGVNGGLQSVTVESNGILYSQAAGCQQYNGMFS